MISATHLAFVHEPPAPSAYDDDYQARLDEDIARLKHEWEMAVELRRNSELKRLQLDYDALANKSRTREIGEQMLGLEARMNAIRAKDANIEGVKSANKAFADIGRTARRMAFTWLGAQILRALGWLAWSVAGVAAAALFIKLYLTE